MTGDDEDAINIADEDAVHLTVSKDGGPKKKDKVPEKHPVKKKKRRLWILLAIIFIIIIIAVPFAATYQEPTVNVVGMEIKVSGVGYSKVYTLFATVQVDNPNIVGVTVNIISGSYYVNGVKAGDFQRLEPVIITAGSSTTFDVQVLPTIPGLIHPGQSNTVRVKGTANIQGIFNSWDVPFDKTQGVPVP